MAPAGMFMAAEAAGFTVPAAEAVGVIPMAGFTASAGFPVLAGIPLAVLADIPVLAGIPEDFRARTSDPRAGRLATPV